MKRFILIGGLWFFSNPATKANKVGFYKTQYIKKRNTLVWLSWGLSAIGGFDLEQLAICVCGGLLNKTWCTFLLICSENSLICSFYTPGTKKDPMKKWAYTLKLISKHHKKTASDHYDIKYNTFCYAESLVWRDIAGTDYFGRERLWVVKRFSIAFTD